MEGRERGRVYDIDVAGRERERGREGRGKMCHSRGQEDDGLPLNDIPTLPREQQERDEYGRDTTATNWQLQSAFVSLHSI